MNLSGGSPLVAGKRFAALTDSEEDAMTLTDVALDLLAHCFLRESASQGSV
jgi:hypothetical protein